MRIDYIKIILLKIAHLTIFHTFLPKPEEIRHIPEHFHHLGVVVGLVQGLVVSAEENKNYYNIDKYVKKLDLYFN